MRGPTTQEEAREAAPGSTASSLAGVLQTPSTLGAFPQSCMQTEDVITKILGK